MNLDNQQKAAVEAEENNVIVVAGAGSGKTKVITERVRFLLEKKKVAPKTIVCITFTNLAAEEMRERLATVKDSADCFIGTIHSFAHRCMKARQNYRIFNDLLDMEFHKDLIDKYCRHIDFDKYVNYRALKEKVVVGKEDEQKLEDFLTYAERTELALINRPIEAITPKDAYPETIPLLCKRYNVISFDELLQRAIKFFESTDSFPTHVLVDEFQDVGTNEFKFITSLKAKNYFFVGDDWQSIYGFKGGNVDIFKSCVSDGKFKPYYLENNYRNAYNIMEVGRRVLFSVPDKIEKKVNIVSKQKGDVSILSDTRDKGILQSLLKQIKIRKDFKDWFLLVRNNKDLYKVAGILQSLEIPFIQFKREGIELSEIRDLLKADAVKLLTVHGAKGLESKNVILSGNFPVERPSYMKDPEERKIMYVGITRAQENLFILN